MSYKKPVLRYSRLLKADRSNLGTGANDEDITGYDKSLPLIVVAQIDEQTGPWTSTYTLRWRNETDNPGGSFSPLASTGQVKWATSGETSLTDAATISEANQKCGTFGGHTWYLGREVEAASTSASIALPDENYTEIHFGISLADAHDGDQYTFELYENGGASSVGTLAAQITTAQLPNPSVSDNLNFQEPATTPDVDIGGVQPSTISDALNFEEKFPTPSGAQPEMVGSVQYITSNVQNSSQSITVPSGADTCVIGVAGYSSGGSANFLGSGATLTLGGNQFTLIRSDGASAATMQTALWYLKNLPSAGSQTLAWNWLSTVTYGISFYIAFYKNVHVIRSSGGQQSAGGGGTASTGSLNAVSGDLFFCTANHYQATDGVLSWSGCTEIRQDTYNSQDNGCAQASPTGSFTATASEGGSNTTISGVVLGPTQYFGACNSDGTPLSETPSTDYWYDIWAMNHTYVTGFVCPGSGLMSVVDLKAYVLVDAVNESYPALMRLAIYDADRNLIAEGNAALTVINTSLAWIGYDESTLTPSNPTLNGGQTYYLAITTYCSGASHTYALHWAYNSCTSGDTEYVLNTNYTAGFPDPIGDGNAFDQLPYIRCGVKVSAGGGNPQIGDVKATSTDLYENLNFFEQITIEGPGAQWPQPSVSDNLNFEEPTTTPTVQVEGALAPFVSDNLDFYEKPEDVRVTGDLSSTLSDNLDFYEKPEDVQVTGALSPSASDNLDFYEKPEDVQVTGDLGRSLSDGLDFYEKPEDVQVSGDLNAAPAADGLDFNEKVDVSIPVVITLSDNLNFQEPATTPTVQVTGALQPSVSDSLNFFDEAPPYIGHLHIAYEGDSVWVVITTPEQPVSVEITGVNADTLNFGESVTGQVDGALAPQNVYDNLDFLENVTAERIEAGPSPDIDEGLAFEEKITAEVTGDLSATFAADILNFENVPTAQVVGDIIITEPTPNIVNFQEVITTRIVGDILATTSPNDTLNLQENLTWQVTGSCEAKPLADGLNFEDQVTAKVEGALQVQPVADTLILFEEDPEITFVSIVNPSVSDNLNFQEAPLGIQVVGSLNISLSDGLNFQDEIHDSKVTGDLVPSVYDDLDFSDVQITPQVDGALRPSLSDNVNFEERPLDARVTGALQPSVSDDLDFSDGLFEIRIGDLLRALPADGLNFEEYLTVQVEVLPDLFPSVSETLHILEAIDSGVEGGLQIPGLSENLNFSENVDQRVVTPGAPPTGFTFQRYIKETPAHSPSRDFNYKRLK